MTYPNTRYQRQPATILRECQCGATLWSDGDVTEPCANAICDWRQRNIEIESEED